MNWHCAAGRCDTKPTCLAAKRCLAITRHYTSPIGKMKLRVDDGSIARAIAAYYRTKGYKVVRTSEQTTMSRTIVAHGAEPQNPDLDKLSSTELMTWCGHSGERWARAFMNRVLGGRDAIGFTRRDERGRICRDEHGNPINYKVDMDTMRMWFAVAIETADITRYSQKRLDEFFERNPDLLGIKNDPETQATKRTAPTQSFSETG